MSLTGTSNSNYRRVLNALSPTLTSANTLLFMCWAKLSSAGAGTARGIGGVNEDGSVATTHGIIAGGVSATNTLQTVLRSNASLAVNDTTNSSIAAFHDVWAHYAWLMEGPHDGTSKTWEVRVNDTLWDSGSYTSQTYSSTIDSLRIGGSIAAAAPNAADQYAYLALANPASMAAARVIVTAAQTTDPASISGIAHAWDLNNRVTAQVGGPSLAAVGTGGTLDTAMPTFASGASALIGAGTATGAPATDIIGQTRPSPPSIGAWDIAAVGGGGGGQVIIASTMMRGEGAYQQVRRHGFTGWRA